MTETDEGAKKITLRGAKERTHYMIVTHGAHPALVCGPVAIGPIPPFDELPKLGGGAYYIRLGWREVQR